MSLSSTQRVSKRMGIKMAILVIFFSLTEAPLPDPIPTPPNTPKRTRNRPKTDPKQSQTEPNGAETEPNRAEMDRNQAFRGGTGGGFVGVAGVGGCKGKRKSLGKFLKFERKLTVSLNIFFREKRHININFLLWLTSRWPWDKWLVVPGLTGPKSLCVRLETQEI